MHSMHHRLRLVLVALLAAHVCAERVEIAPSTSQFQQWYPQYEDVFRTILRQNCSDEYNKYLTGVRKESDIDVVGGGSFRSALTQPLISCILYSTGEYVKAQLAASQVLLGVAPTILALMGPSAEETATFLLVARRPVLFLSIILSSPSVFFSRAFEYSDPVKILEDHPLRLVRSRPTGMFRAVVTVGEYVLALASVVNIAWVSYELGTKTICVFLSVWSFSPLIWALLGIVIHLMSLVTLRMRVRRLYNEELRTSDDLAMGVERVGFAGWLRRTPSHFLACLRNEPKIAACQSYIQLVVFPESRLYIIMAWVLSASTVTHILFGTLLFSSTLFIGPEDAVGIIVRYVASVMACRAILMYELSGLRDSFRRARDAGEYIEGDGIIALEPESDVNSGSFK